MKTKRILMTAGILAAAALSISACGGGDEDGSGCKDICGKCFTGSTLQSCRGACDECSAQLDDFLICADRNTNNVCGIFLDEDDPELIAQLSEFCLNEALAYRSCMNEDDARKK